MDIHFIEDKIIRGEEITLVFFNKDTREHHDSKYIEMIDKSPVLYRDFWVNVYRIKDDLGNEYVVKKVDAIAEDGSSDWKQDSKMDCKLILDKRVLGRTVIPFFKTKLIFKKFLENNSLPIDTEMTEVFFDKYLAHLNVFRKFENRGIRNWNLDYSQLINGNKCFALVIVNGEIAGNITCESFSDEDALQYVRDKDIMYPEMNLYISNVNVRIDFQGKGLCKPLVTYMVKHLKRLGYDMLFIENASRTGGGIPACICYYTAGIFNNYNMRYKVPAGESIGIEDSDPFKKMSIGDCFKGKNMPSTYFYVSDKYTKSAKEKFRKSFQKKRK